MGAMLDLKRPPGSSHADCRGNPTRIALGLHDLFEFNRVSLQILEADKFQGRDVRCFEHHWGRYASFQSLSPAFDTQTPAISRHQTRKVEHRVGSGQIIPPLTREREELGRHPGADKMQTDVSTARVAVAIPIKTRHG